MLKRSKQPGEEDPSGEANPQSADADHRGRRAIVALGALATFLVIGALASALDVGLPFGGGDEPPKDPPRAALPPEWRDMDPLRPLFPDGGGPGVTSDRARDRSGQRPPIASAPDALPRVRPEGVASRPRLRTRPPDRPRPRFPLITTGVIPDRLPVLRLVRLGPVVTLYSRVRVPTLPNPLGIDLLGLDLLLGGEGLRIDLGIDIPEIGLLPGFELSPIGLPVGPRLPVEPPDLPGPIDPLAPARLPISTGPLFGGLPRVASPLGASILEHRPRITGRTAGPDVGPETDASPASAVPPEVDRRLSRSDGPSSDAARPRSAPASEPPDGPRRSVEQQGEGSGDGAGETSSFGSTTSERRSVPGRALEAPAGSRAGDPGSRPRPARRRARRQRSRDGLPALPGGERRRRGRRELRPGRLRKREQKHDGDDARREVSHRGPENEDPGPEDDDPGPDQDRTGREGDDPGREGDDTSTERDGG